MLIDLRRCLPQQSSDESEKSNSEWDDWDNETEDVTILLQDLAVFFR